MPSRPDHSILMFNHIFLSIFLFFIAISALIMSGMNETVDDRRLECVERCGMIFSPCIYIYIYAYALELNKGAIKRDEIT